MVVYAISIVLLVCFGFISARYNMELWLSRHAETGATLSANHDFPVGGVTLVVRCRHSIHSLRVSTIGADLPLCIHKCV